MYTSFEGKFGLGISVRTPIRWDGDKLLLFKEYIS